MIVVYLIFLIVMKAKERGPLIHRTEKQPCYSLSLYLSQRNRRSTNYDKRKQLTTAKNTNRKKGGPTTAHVYIMAGVKGFEPLLTVLETAVLPLH